MWWYLLIKNSVVVICFTLLSIHFDKWWIVLFSLLCVSTISSTKHDHSDKGER